MICEPEQHYLGGSLCHRLNIPLAVYRATADNLHDVRGIVVYFVSLYDAKCRYSLLVTCPVEKNNVTGLNLVGLCLAKVGLLDGVTSNGVATE